MKIILSYSNTNLTQFNPSYQKIIKNLEQQLNDCDSDYDKDKRIKIMLKYASEYLLPSKYWYKILRHHIYYYKYRFEIAKMAYDQFYRDINFLESMRTVLHKNISFKNLKFVFKNKFEGTWDVKDPVLQYDEKIDLLYPHSHLIQCFNDFKSISNRPLSKKLIAIYEKNKTYYEKLIAAENDVEQWFYLLCEAANANNDAKIVTNNIGYRLGKNLQDIKLWKLYIEYLRIHDSDEMLQVYSKYCRLFLDDNEMKETYKREVEIYGPIYVQWKNLFDFEKEKLDDDPSAPKRLNFLTQKDIEDKIAGKVAEKTTEIIPSDDKMEIDQPSNDNDDPELIHSEILTLCKNFNSTFQHQNFSFKNPLILYILDNINYSILRKLYETCKFFYIQKNMPICHRLSYTKGETKFFEESLSINHDGISSSLLKNTYLTTVFDGTDMCAKDLSTIIPKLYQCNAKYINIQCKLSMNELKFLIESGNVVIFEWTRKMDKYERNVKAWEREFFSENIDGLELLLPEEEEDEISLALEDVMQYMPKIEKLKISPVLVTSTTFTALLDQEFQSKIYHIKLGKIHGEAFDINDFLKFCIKNRARQFILKMGFHENFDNDFDINKLSKNMKKYETSVKETQILIW